MGKSVQRSKKPVAGAAAGKNRGKGPAKGAVGAGRPSEEYRAEARSLLNSPQAKKSVRTVLSDPDNRNFATVYKYLHERAYGREPISAELTVPKGLVVRVVREDRR